MSTRESTDSKARKGHQELLCLDFGHSGVKAVRMRRQRDQAVVTEVDVLEAVPLSADAGGAGRLELGSTLRAKYAALAFAPRGMIVRMLNLPGHGDAGATIEQQVRRQFELTEDYRVGCLSLGNPAPRGPVRLVAAAVPEPEAQAVLRHLATGAPAPYSLECSGLTALTAFAHGSGTDRSAETTCLIEGGAHTLFVFFLSRGSVALLRRYDVGTEDLIDRLGQDLGVDRDMALSILSEGAVDIAALVHDVMGPVFKQFAISRDFVERHEKSGRIDRVWLSGGLALSAVWRRQLAEVTGLPVEPFNPFAGLTTTDGALPEAFAGQEPRFAAAVGAGLGAWYET